MQAECESLVNIATQTVPETREIDSPYYDVYDVLMNNRIPGNALDAYFSLITGSAQNMTSISFSVFQYRGIGFHETDSSSALTERVKQSVKLVPQMNFSSLTKVIVNVCLIRYVLGKGNNFVE